MSTTEAILEKLHSLPPEKQVAVLHFLEAISQPPIPTPEPRAETDKPHAWMDIAMSMKLDGPPDMSEHLDDYLYGDKKHVL